MISKNSKSNSTIVACATAPGQSAIAIVRMSGNKSLDIVSKIWKPISKKKQMPRELVLGWLVEDGNNIDQAMVVNMPSPKSYTGEDIVEIHLHGSMAIVHKAIQLCIKNGALLAENGEFSKRAYLNGKLDLSQAEAVSELISSSNARMMRLASKQLAGEFSKSIADIKSQLLNIAAYLSASLDFSEEDIEAQKDSATQGQIELIEKQINQLLEGSDNLAVVREGFHVVFIGLPNAGKSTLLNKLVGYDRSIVTEIAGTTRDTITEPIMLNDSIVQITDTAGLHTSRDKVEKLGIKRTLDEIKNSDFVLVLVEPDSLLQTQQFLEENNIDKILNTSNCLVVFTKSDIKHQEPSKTTFFNNYKSISISTKTNHGIRQLKDIISHNSNMSGNQSDLKLLTNRQLVLLNKLNSQIKDMGNKLKTKTPPDILAVEVQSAISICNEITGEETTQEIIDEVFSSFCIGK